MKEATEWLDINRTLYVSLWSVGEVHMGLLEMGFVGTIEIERTILLSVM